MIRGLGRGRAVRAGAALAAVGALGALLSSCAYYNTFYLARKYYDVATTRQPYLVERPAQVDNTNFNKSIDFSKKVISFYPKSKWVDDAYLLWARALLGKDDPTQTVNMLQDFELRYPKSSIRAEARFYLGVGYRQSRKYKDAVKSLDEFLEMAPKNDLAPYAYLERARALVALQDYGGAAASAGHVLERWSHSRLRTQARLARADAYFKQGEYEKARADYHRLGLEADEDEERFGYLLREADCLEAAQAFDQEMALLKGAQSHEVPPPPQPEPPPPGTVPPVIQTPPPSAAQPTGDRFGRLMVRIGSVSLLQGRVDEGIAAYRSVVRNYPRTPLAAEAQYRVGYAYETAADDFEKARAEYARVREIANSAFVDQATQRLTNLDRLAKFRSTARDTVEARAEERFLLAEQYLFQIDKPERALDEYRKIEHEFPGTAWAAKAIIAQAWVLSRKLDRKPEADSLFWAVVRNHPATEAQLAARDYLEMEGADVPAGLIQLPVRQLAQADTVPLTPVPDRPTALGGGPGGPADSLGVKPPPAWLVPGATLMHPPAPPEVGPPVPEALGPPAPEPMGPPPPPAAMGPPAPPADRPLAPAPAASGAPGVPPGPHGDSLRVTPRDSSTAATPDTSAAPRKP